MPLPDSLFHTLIHFAPDAFVVADQDGTIAFVNAEAERLFGYSREDLVGGPVDLLVPESLRGGHHVHRDRYWDDPHTRPMGNGLALVARRRDGSELPVEISLSPVYSDDRRFVVVTIRDVSERRHIQEALRVSEERYRLMAENAEDVVYRIAINAGAPAFEYLSPSVEALTDYPPSAFADDPNLMSTITHPEDRPLLEQWLRAPMEIEPPLLLRAVRPDGEVLWHEQRFRSITDADGTVIAIEGIARDVTEQRLVEEERRLLLAESEIERERERIAGDLHDGVMQTMYSVGLQISSVVRRAPGLGEETSASLQEAIRSLDAAIRDIRSYVMDLRPADFLDDLRASLESLLQRFEVTSRLEVSMDLDRTLPPIDEPVAVELFLLAREALSNTRRHAQASSVRVSLHLTDGTLVLEVVDDGVGFDVATAARTEQFGLRNMASRARLIGGDAVVESEPGRGTTVRVSIPEDRIRPPGATVG
jgi:PAS domain S-box-containing protein